MGYGGGVGEGESARRCFPLHLLLLLLFRHQTFSPFQRQILPPGRNSDGGRRRRQGESGTDHVRGGDISPPAARIRTSFPPALRMPNSFEGGSGRSGCFPPFFAGRGHSVFHQARYGRTFPLQRYQGDTHAATKYYTVLVAAGHPRSHVKHEAGLALRTYCRSCSLRFGDASPHHNSRTETTLKLLLGSVSLTRSINKPTDGSTGQMHAV